MKPEVLDLRGADDPRDLVHRVVERLAHGRLVALPTETVYTVAASALLPAAVERLFQIRDRDSDRPITLAIKSADEARDWVPEMSVLGRRLIRRCWPGPVTLIFNEVVADGLVRQLPDSTRRRICPAGSLGLRVPAHSAVLDCQRLIPWPLAIVSASRNGQLHAATGDQVLENLGEMIDVVLDDGPCRYGQPSSIVRLVGNGWEIVREGVVTQGAIQRLARSLILFVCTGNTCRSPMAEAICKTLLARRLQCRVDELPSRGYEVVSAGVAAVSGDRASPEAIEVARDFGADLSDHVSHELTAETVYQADHIFTMTDSHLRQLAGLVPEAAGRISVLRRDGGNIADPVGLNLEAYRRSASEIESNLRQIIDEIVP